MGRRRRGRGFELLDREGRRLADAEAAERIAALAIPPAWEEVWISPDPMGHIQATGLDARGRRQYIYHPAWIARREREKFDAATCFAKALPRLRGRVECDLPGEDLGRERVLAAATRLLDRGFFRVGGEQYAEENDSYGLATLLKEHVSVRGSEMTFDFPAKSGRHRIQRIDDPELAPLIGALRRRRGGAPNCSPTRTGVAAGATCAPPTSTTTSRRSRALSSPPSAFAPGTRPCWPPSCSRRRPRRPEPPPRRANARSRPR